MTAAFELIRAVEAKGGRLRVEDGWLLIAPESAAAPHLDELREHKAEIIGLLQSRGIPQHDPTEWRKPFAVWLGLDCVREPRCFGGLNCLHLAFCEREINQNGVPCNRDTFERLLEEWGFVMGEVAGVLLVSGLMLKEDWEATQDSIGL